MVAVYFELGVDHILDVHAYDHMLFLVALCGIFGPGDWRRVLILVTSFTLGHSLTLALSAMQLITLPERLVEILIPVTILVTAVQNLLMKPQERASWWWHYGLAMGFGFIHGMGFSAYFTALLGRETHIVLPLFSFNLGVETGQLLIVVIVLGLTSLITGVLGVSQRRWTLVLSVMAGILALGMIIDRI